MSAKLTANHSGPVVVIIGGGVSGLATAYFLGQKGIRSVLIEKSSRLGGLIRTDRIEGCELEAGPDSFLSTKTSVAELASQLGIAQDLMGSNDERRRIFIVQNERLVQMPAGMVMMAPGDLPAALQSDFFSPETKARFLSERSFEPRTRSGDVSIREFVEDHFGPESLEYVTEPLLAGVYGGNAGELSTESVLPRFLHYERQYGSLIRAAEQERRESPSKTSLFLSFRGGMQTFTDALTKAISHYTTVITAEATEVQRTADGWRVIFGAESLDAQHLVLACPAHVNAKLMRSSASSLADELAAIPYSSAILVTLVYRRQELNHELDGFGFLVPERERRGIAAATWISTKFPSRIPPHLSALRGFIVGRSAVELAGSSDEKLIQLVRDEFKRLMNITAKPEFQTVYRWPDSMPQYVVGHGQRTQAIREHARRLPGLHLCGNAYEGVGIPDCVRLAAEVARSIQ